MQSDQDDFFQIHQFGVQVFGHLFVHLHGVGYGKVVGITGICRVLVAGSSQDQKLIKRKIRFINQR